MTRLGAGLPVAVNPDLIERIEETPDTVVTMVDGHKLVVEEPLGDVIAMIREWRSAVAARAIQIWRLEPVVDDADDADDESDASIAAFADRAGAHAHVGRVLRLPTREV